MAISSVVTGITIALGIWLYKVFKKLRKGRDSFEANKRVLLDLMTKCQYRW